MQQYISEFFSRYLHEWYFPDVKIIDLIEIIIISVLIYQLMVWIKNTKAWMLLRGIVVLAVFIFVATLFRMNTILWIAKNIVSVLAVAAIVVFQPELRRALETLGERQFLTSMVPFDTGKERFSNGTIKAIVEAVFTMGKVCTGALIVVEQATKLTEYENTGIRLDSTISSQLLINIFEHNAPLHDGAIIIRGNRVVAATCYLPLSDNMNLSKHLGTRHRAAIGMSEVSDALVIVVSEESGGISVASGGQLVQNVGAEYLRKRLAVIQNKSIESRKLSTLWKGRQKNEADANKESPS